MIMSSILHNLIVGDKQEAKKKSSDCYYSNNKTTIIVIVKNIKVLVISLIVFSVVLKVRVQKNPF